LDRDYTFYTTNATYTVGHRVLVGWVVRDALSRNATLSAVMYWGAPAPFAARGCLRPSACNGQRR